MAKHKMLAQLNNGEYHFCDNAMPSLLKTYGSYHTREDAPDIYLVNHLCCRVVYLPFKLGGTLINRYE